MVVAYLDVTCWAASAGGEHYTGAIKLDKGNGMATHEVEHPLTAKEALYLNKKDRTSYCHHRPGELSPRYKTEEQLCRHAVKLFLSKYKGILIKGFYGRASATPIICCSRGLEKKMERLNELAMEWEHIGGYDEGYDDQASKIDDEWNKICREIRQMDG
jgi:hypothetical protein